ncbi:hypothetical protein UFOVP1528_32 [uncultured Caudovirales phage]|uniref:Uncharacterized protein n=1 Tax=uncultured Caudovirales phage TaxID=2100421 RepID=A0A6J5SFS6_9CAUD|nr:hypothetical protein UFOVP905_43 [uncultured Caudovirales phage]CAB4182981.1 hypothetical protein UFOVP1080_31 [uncultured Caudovirales phage]CAB4197392.1 hypothetical protein UFOVP1321_19 [uncultured Caudovirales phage]CAB4212867.1 hypothetical protein UFOVP1432_44 [uncultured Caudovirales phage]CAB5227377.1 hypothetical protein UFOVP1528_32 [uncultured Caudovirales phage]
MKIAEFDYEKFKPVLVDATGRKLTVGLFEELADPATGIKPVFKLSDWRKVYIEISDPTGYEAAKALIGNWDHWLALINNQRFAAEVARWNTEVEIKLRCEAIAQMVKHSKSGQGTTAAKWLAEGGFTARDKRNKKDKQDEEDTGQDVREHAKRLGFIKGGKP